MEQKIPEKWKDCAFHESSRKELKGLRGVYLIYEEDTEPVSVCLVGWGDLAKGIEKHLAEEELTLSFPQGVRVRYREFSEEEQPGIVRYLILHYEHEDTVGKIEPKPLPFDETDSWGIESV